MVFSEAIARGNPELGADAVARLLDAVSMPAISRHLKRIYADNELEREATLKPYLMVQTEGDRLLQQVEVGNGPASNEE